MCGDHSIAKAADDSTLQSSASGADTGSGNALFFEPGVGKKCFASCSCCAVDCYAKNKIKIIRVNRTILEKEAQTRTLKATRPTRMPAMKKIKAMKSQMTPHTFVEF